ncbi:hypothetical protein [Halobacteriovorax sp. HLS]|uniref:hypothetical protein n=1 Tax=Halobacteriovorax sp. HLS TaxID=2234000 RepID=UPI000FD98372|nr:hypothetical protein [Halobacteriovorax sp. HLS]
MTVDSTTLTEISFSELKDIKLSYGDLYWKKKDGKCIRLLNVGEIVDINKLAKFEKVTAFLYLDLKCNRSYIEQGVKILTSILNSTDEKERLELRRSFLSHLYPLYWSGENEGVLLDLVMIFQNTFYSLDEYFGREMDAKALSFYQRSCLVSTLITLSALVCGYTHGAFLKDLYNTCYFFDYSYAITDHSSLELEKIENARVNHLPFGHEIEMVRKSIESFNYKYSHTNLSNLIRFHHEFLNGEGLVIGSNQEEIGELEKLVIFIEASVEFNKTDYLTRDARGFLKKLFCELEYDECVIEESLKELLGRDFESISTKMENAA